MSQFKTDVVDVCKKSNVCGHDMLSELTYHTKKFRKCWRGNLKCPYFHPRGRAWQEFYEKKLCPHLHDRGWVKTETVVQTPNFVPSPPFTVQQCSEELPSAVPFILNPEDEDYTDMPPLVSLDSKNHVQVDLPESESETEMDIPDLPTAQPVSLKPEVLDKLCNNVLVPLAVIVLYGLAVRVLYK